MKILILLLFISCIGCHQPDYPDPPEFKAYLNNPVLRNGDSLSWDNLMIVAPAVVWHDSVCYLFYAGFNQNGPVAVGLATSDDGFHFKKAANNPVFLPDGTGFDAYSIGGTTIIREDSGWLMMYGASNIAGWGPGPFIGRAVSESLTGPWMRNDQPVLSTGSKGEWDSYYVFPVSLLTADDGTYMMYYAGGNGFDIFSPGSIGLATSNDGITWQKYNDPSTKQRPFSESDPVLTAGEKNDWDCSGIWTCSVVNTPMGYQAYFSGEAIDTAEMMSVGFAFSNDGRHWIKYRENPIFKVEDDPFGSSLNKNAILECPSVLNHDGVLFLYYDYGSTGGGIGVATAPL